MAKRILAILLLIVNLISAEAQTQQEAVGRYHLRGGSYFLRPDSTFVIIGYATLITGTWKMGKAGEVLFTPNYPKEPFALYGRHNNSLGNKVKFMLSYGLEERPTVMYLGRMQTTSSSFKLIYNVDNNCNDFPQIYTSTQKADTISFAELLNENTQKYPPTIYSFYNEEQQNDFIVYFFKDDTNYHPFVHTFKNDTLFYRDSHWGTKQSLTEASEDSELYDIKHVNFTPDHMLITPKYKNYDGGVEDEMFKLNYTFYAAKNAFLQTLNYVDDEENTADYDYNNLNILYDYKLIKTFTKSKRNISVDKDPIFNNHCE